MKKINASLLLLSVFLGFSINTAAQTVLTADGPGNTYELINSILAPTGGDVVENPECVHPEFGRHIAEVWDADLNEYVFEFYIHTAIDNDRCINFDRQRMEIKTYEASPTELKGDYGETVVYKWRFKVPVGFQASSNFTHIHQIKAVGGDDEMPLFTLSPRKGSPNKMELIHNNTTKVSTVNLSSFEGVWVEAIETIFVDSLAGTYSMIINKVSDGTNILSYSNNNIMTIRSTNTFIRPKWGIYRSLTTSTDLRDETIRFNSFSIAELKSQTINFPVLPIKSVGDDDFSPSATASSGLQITYSSSNTSVAKIINNQIHIVGIGTSIITASQEGNSVYNPAPSVSQTLAVSNLTLTLNPTEDSYIYGGAQTTNYGTTNSLPIKNNGDITFLRKVYYKFDLTGSDYLSLGSLSIAKLRLYCNSISLPTIISIATSANTWTETGIIYTNAPVTLTPLGTLNITAASSYYDLDITSYIQSSLNTNSNVFSFVVFDNTSANTMTKFNSREAITNKPELVLAGMVQTTTNRNVKPENNFNYSVDNATRSVNIEYTLTESGNVGLAIYSLNGQIVTTLINRQQTEGNYQTSFDFSNLNAGIYLIRFMASNYTKTTKLYIKN